MAEINMTPLVDVMLVLLIVFMITIPVMQHAVKVDLPQASSQRNEVKPDLLSEHCCQWSDLLESITD